MKNFIKDRIIDILFFGTIILIFWGGFKFSEYQMKGLKNFDGFTIEQCQQYYYNYVSNYPENF